MRTGIRTGQRRAERLMQSRGLCERPTEAVSHEDGTTGVTFTPVYGDTDCPWAGKCKVQSFRPYETVLISGGRPVVEQRTEVHVPVSAGPFKVGDVWTISGFDYKFRVSGVDEKTLQTAQRLLVDEVTNRG